MCKFGFVGSIGHCVKNQVCCWQGGGAQKNLVSLPVQLIIILYNKCTFGENVHKQHSTGGWFDAITDRSTVSPVTVTKKIKIKNTKTTATFSTSRHTERKTLTYNTVLMFMSLSNAAVGGSRCVPGWLQFCELLSGWWIYGSDLSLRVNCMDRQTTVLRHYVYLKVWILRQHTWKSRSLEV